MSTVLMVLSVKYLKQDYIVYEYLISCLGQAKIMSDLSLGKSDIKLVSSPVKEVILDYWKTIEVNVCLKYINHIQPALPEVVEYEASNWALTCYYTYYFYSLPCFLLLFMY